ELANHTVDRTPAQAHHPKHNPRTEGAHRSTRYMSVVHRVSFGPQHIKPQPGKVCRRFLQTKAAYTITSRFELPSKRKLDGSGRQPSNRWLGDGNVACGNSRHLLQPLAWFIQMVESIMYV